MAKKKLCPCGIGTPSHAHNQPVAKLSREDSARLWRRIEKAICLDDLVKALDRVHADPQYQAVWRAAQDQLGKYIGPTYTKELRAAKAALRR